MDAEVAVAPGREQKAAVPEDVEGGRGGFVGGLSDGLADGGEAEGTAEEVQKRNGQRGYQRKKKPLHRTECRGGEGWGVPLLHHPDCRARTDGGLRDRALRID